MALVGVLPQGFPPFTIPDVGLSDIGLLLGGAAGIAIVSLTDTISTASSFAARSGDEIDGQREMIGIGAANITDVQPTKPATSPPRRRPAPRPAVTSSGLCAPT